VVSLLEEMAAQSCTCASFAVMSFYFVVVVVVLSSWSSRLPHPAIINQKNPELALSIVFLI
jgi:hypothetical protein